MKNLLMIVVVLLANIAYGQNENIVGQTLTLKSSSLPKVSTASVRANGQTGNTVYYYWVIANFNAGQTPAGGPFVVPNGNNILSASNNNVINFQPINGANTYDIIRSNSPMLPNSGSNMLVVSGLTNTTYTDQSNSLGVYNYNVVNNWSANFRVDNTTYTSPRQLLDTTLQVPELCFVDGTCQSTSGGTGAGVPVNTLATLPATCTVGQLSFVTDSTPSQIFKCDPPNTWIATQPTAYSDGTITVVIVNGQVQFRVTPNTTLSPSANLSDLVSAATARTNLGLTSNATATITNAANTRIAVHSDSSGSMNDAPGGGSAILWNGYSMTLNGALNLQLDGTGNTQTCSSTATLRTTVASMARVTLTGNCTLSATGTNGSAIFGVIICQDATGGRTLTWPSSFVGTMTISSTANSCSTQLFVSDTTRNQWLPFTSGITGL